PRLAAGRGEPEIGRPGAPGLLGRHPVAVGRRQRGRPRLQPAVRRATGPAGGDRPAVPPGAARVRPRAAARRQGGAAGRRFAGAQGGGEESGLEAAAYRRRARPGPARGDGALAQATGLTILANENTLPLTVGAP